MSSARGRRKAPGSIYSGVDQLGRTTAQPQSPAEAVLERVPNPHPRKV